MPTYDYRCELCGREESIFQSIREYTLTPIRPRCCFAQEMERKLSVVPGTIGGIANALAGDRHYEGLRAPDGTDIGSRTKHREYMRAHGLTTADDFTETWRASEKERTELRQGTSKDKELRSEIERQVITATMKSE